MKSVDRMKNMLEWLEKQYEETHDRGYELQATILKWVLEED